jgi:hypothetical protein
MPDTPPMTSSTSNPPLRRAAWQAVFAFALLAVAGLRHHLVWGGSLRWVFDVLETGCLCGFAWFGARAWLSAMRIVREGSPGLRQLILLSLPILAMAVAVPAFLSADIADYVMRGRVLALHGGNPYTQMATDFPDDPFLVFGDSAWKQFPLPYGPLVADLQGVVAWLANLCSFLPAKAEFLLATGLFKAVFAASLLACACLARDIYRQLGRSDHDVAFIAVLWNPLLLNEGVATAHNESLVLLTLLIALRGALAGRGAVSGFSLGLGVLTKIVPVLLGPVLLVWAMRRRQLLGFAIGGCASLVLLALYYLRFFDEPGALDFLQKQSGVVGASPVWAIAGVLGLDIQNVLTFGRGIVVVVVLVMSVQLWRRPEPEQLVHACAVSLAAMVCFGMGGFGPWYHIWWIPLAMIGRPGFLQRFALVATVTSPLCYVVWTSVRILDEGHEWVQLSMGLLVPAVVAWFWRPSASQQIA